MTELSIKNKTAELEKAIVDGVLEKKAIKGVVMDFSHMQNVAFERFVICTGTSTPQTSAIADSVIDTVISQCNEKPWHIEGRDNAEWILLDYGNIIVHVFLQEKRGFYKLEELWGDAVIRPITE